VDRVEESAPCPECEKVHPNDVVCSFHIVSCGTNEPVEAEPAVTTPEPAATELSDQTVGGFRLLKQLGLGATGTVYLARHEVIGSTVAIKALHERFVANERLVAQFYDEARAVNVIGHENIVRIFDLHVLPPAKYYLVMEHLDGRPLSALANSPLAPRVAIPILTQICEALEAAHRVGVVHQDVKPDNVILLRRGRANFVKLLDFGAVRLKEGSGEASPRRLVMGTPAYMPPEQWKGGPVDGRTDIYALGVTAYLLATGTLPFRLKGKPLREMARAHRTQLPPPPHLVNPEVPQAWSEAILQALAKRPEDRFASAKDFGAAMRGVLSRARRRQPPEPGLVVESTPTVVTCYVPQASPDPSSTMPWTQAVPGFTAVSSVHSTESD
jgi:serine/threonine protein kinase